MRSIFKESVFTVLLAVFIATGLITAVEQCLIFSASWLVGSIIYQIFAPSDG